MSAAAREAAVDMAARTPPPRLTSDQVAARLGITIAERTSLALTTIGAVDCLAAQRAELRKLRRREQNRARRQRARKAAAAAAPPRQEPQSPRVDAVRAALAAADEWTSVTSLAALLVHHPAFQGRRGRSLNAEALRKAVIRAADLLLENGEVEQRHTTTKFGVAARHFLLAASAGLAEVVRPDKRERGENSRGQRL
jgi:hypothetical protein